MTKNTNLNTKYTCIPLNQPQYANNQQVINSNNGNNNQYWNGKQNETQSTPLKSLERLVALPETQVIDPKSVVNDNNDCISSNYDYSNNLGDNSYQQPQYKTNLKRGNSNDYSDDFFNKKACGIQQPMPEINNQQQQQQQYYYNNTGYYLQQNSNEMYLGDQRHQQQQQQTNDNYFYQENNNYDRMNFNYDYIHHQQQQHQEHNQQDYSYNDQYNQQYQQSLGLPQQYYQYQPQQTQQQQPYDLI